MLVHVGSVSRMHAASGMQDLRLPEIPVLRRVRGATSAGRYPCRGRRSPGKVAGRGWARVRQPAARAAATWRAVTAMRWCNRQPAHCGGRQRRADGLNLFDGRCNRSSVGEAEVVRRRQRDVRRRKKMGPTDALGRRGQRHAGCPSFIVLVIESAYRADSACGIALETVSAGRCADRDGAPGRA